MKKFTMTSLLVLCMLSTIMCNVLAQDGSESKLEKEFEGISMIDIFTVSGDCRIVKSDSKKVKLLLDYDYRPSGTFKPTFSKKGNKLVLKERMTGSNSGNSTWTLMVPAEMDINFESSSGGIVLRGIVGTMDIKSSSGNIDALGTKITGNSKFVSSSGDVEVRFEESPQFDVLIRSSSGNATANFSDNPLIGNVEMRARTKVGRIRCPIKFDVEEARLLSSSQEYWIKSFTVGQNSPQIRIYTASGEARLRK